MDRTEVSSSNINSVGYDPEDEILEVEFAGGGVYIYRDVPKETYDLFMASGSLGKFFGVHIRPRFEFEKVMDIPDEDGVESPSSEVTEESDE